MARASVLDLSHMLEVKSLTDLVCTPRVKYHSQRRVGVQMRTSTSARRVYLRMMVASASGDEECEEYTVQCDRENSSRHTASYCIRF